MKDDKLKALRNTIAPGLSGAEFELFCETCKATGLNPITKEIWAIKIDGRLKIMSGFNGFLKIANSHAQYDGMEVDITVDKDGKPLVAQARVYRKDRKFPSVGVALMSEFRGNSPIWQKMPSVMLSKVAKSHAIREAFSIELAGLYTPEEMPPSFDVPRMVESRTLKTLDKEEVIDEASEEWMKDTAIYIYDLSLLAEEKRDAAKEYLLKNEALPAEENEFLFYASKPLKKAANFLKEIVDGSDQAV